MDVNVALVSMMTNNFYTAFVGFIKSLLKTNPWFEKEQVPFIIIDVGIKPKTKAKMKEWYPHIQFRQPKYENYKNVNFSKTAPILRATYYKIDMLSYWDFDRIVFIDLDTIVQKNIRELFEIKAPFAAAHGYNFRNDSMRHDINSGVIVINREHLNETDYKGVIKIAERGLSMPDQKALYGYFRGKISFLPKKFNCEKRLVKSKKFRELWNDQCCIIHYISQKPWDKEPRDIHNQGFEEAEAIWWGYYNA